MISNTMKVSFGIAIGAIGAFATSAQAASLDPAFGSAGIASTAFGSYGAAARVVIQSDGRIVTAGQTALGEFALARYTTSGALDTSFNGTGKVTTTPSGSCSGQARALALQADGKIVVAGTSCPNFTSTRNFTIYRYNTDGSLDTSFGSSGKATVNFYAGASEANAVAVQGSSIWVAGYAGSGFALARLTSGGTLDYSFGGGTGTVTSSVGTSSSFANSLVIQADGKPVLAGYASSSGTVFALARYTTSGALDATFGTGGKVLTNVAGTSAGNSAIATSLAIQSDGNLVAAGYAKSASAGPYRFAVVRYTGTGALDKLLWIRHRQGPYRHRQRRCDRRRCCHRRQRRNHCRRLLQCGQLPPVDLESLRLLRQPGCQLRACRHGRRQRERRCSRARHPGRRQGRRRGLWQLASGLRGCALPIS